MYHLIAIKCIPIPATAHSYLIFASYAYFIFRSKCTSSYAATLEISQEKY